MNAVAAAAVDEELSKARLRLWLKLLKRSRRMENEVRDKFRQTFGSTLPRFDVMSALDRFPDGLRMSELSGVLKVSHGNVTGIVERLVQDGLVSRTAVQGDRRALVVRLTAQGIREFAQQAVEHEGWISELLRDVDLDDAQQLMRALDKVAPSTSDEEDHR